MTSGGMISLVASIVFAITLPERHLIPLAPRLDAAIVSAWQPPFDRFYDFALAEFRLKDGGGELVSQDDIYGDGVRPAWLSFYFVTSACFLVTLGPRGIFALQLNALLTTLPTFAAIYGAFGLVVAPYWSLRSHGAGWRCVGAVSSATLFVYLCMILANS